jgi:hypothetical protein
VDSAAATATPATPFPAIKATPDMVPSVAAMNIILRRIVEIGSVSPETRGEIAAYLESTPDAPNTTAYAAALKEEVDKAHQSIEELLAEVTLLRATNEQNSERLEMERAALQQAEAEASRLAGYCLAILEPESASAEGRPMRMIREEAKKLAAHMRTRAGGVTPWMLKQFEHDRFRKKVHEALVGFVGCEPERLNVNYVDHLMQVIDPRDLMRALGGPWLDVLRRIEDHAKAKHAGPRHGANT